MYILFAEKLEREEGLLIDPGSIFGDEDKGFIRLNVACPKYRIEKAVKSLSRVLSQY